MMPPWSLPSVPAVSTPPWRATVKPATAKPVVPAEDITRASTFLADLRKALAHNVYVDNVKVHEILLALAIAGDFGVSKEGTSTFVPMRAFPVPPRGCPGGYDLVNRGKGYCVIQPEASYEAGIARFLALVDSLDPIAYTGDLPQFFNELFKNSDYTFLDQEGRVRLVIDVLRALDMETSALGQPLLWDTTSEALQSWMKRLVQGGSGTPADDTNTGAGTPTLPSEQVERIKKAGQAVVKQLPPAWAQELLSLGGEATKGALNFLVSGALGLGLAMSNFGLVKTPEGADKNEIRETNNWLKLGKLDAKATDCDASSLFDVDSNRCVTTFPTVEAGVDYFYKSLSDPKASKVHDALVSGDIGKLAAAFLDAGYLYPVGTTQEAWSAFKDRLKTAFLAINSAAGQDSGWKETDYKPGFPSVSTVGGDGKDPNTSTNDKKEEGLSTGAKVAIGVGVVGLVGAVVWALASSPPAPSSLAPATSALPPTTTPPQLPASNAPSGSYLTNPTSASERELREWQDFASTTADPQWLWYLAQSGSVELRNEVAGNRNAPLAVKEFLVRDPDLRVRGKAATEVAYLTRDPAWLRWLAKASFHEGDRFFMQKYIAKNPATPLDVRMWLMKNAESGDVIAEIATRPDLTHGEAMEISQSRDHLIRRALAGNQVAAPDILAALVMDANPYVQIAAIKNPSTPLAFVESLSGQLHPYVSAAREERLGIKKKGRGKSSALRDETPESEDTRRPRKGTAKSGTEHERLVGIFTEARKAAIAAANRTSEGVTSNYDNAYLPKESATRENLKAAKEAGFSPSRVSRGKVFLSIPVRSMSDKRTVQAEAIAKVLNARGIDASVYYKMD